jgi:hypothetical protein
VSKEEQPLPGQPEITIDAETAAMLQAIENAGDDVHELAEIARLDPDLLAAYAKATGQQDDPEVKALIQAARERMSGPTP